MVTASRRPTGAGDNNNSKVISESLNKRALYRSLHNGRICIRYDSKDAQGFHGNETQAVKYRCDSDARRVAVRTVGRLSSGSITGR